MKTKELEPISPVRARARRPAGRPGVRAALALAALALGAAPAPARGSGLDEALRRLASDDILVADAAVEEIVAFGTPAVDSLLVRLDHPARDVRAGAVRGLGLLADPRAASELRARLAASVGRDAPDTMESRYLRILLIQAVGRVRDAGAVELLRGIARAGDAFERAHAAVSLVALDADPGYDLVRECLADPDPALRSVAAEGLGEAGGPAGVPLLLEAARDEAWVVRDAAYRALGRFREDPAVAGALSRGAADPSWYVRRTVAEATGGGR